MKKGSTYTPWSKEEESWLGANYPAKSYKELVAHLGRSKRAIESKLTRLGLILSPNFWSEEEIALLRELYPRTLKQDLCRSFNHPESSIQSKALELGLLKDADTLFKAHSLVSKRYTVLDSYFESIDTPDKAYILGFILGDGSVSDTTLKIELHQKDTEILEYIKRELQYSGPIHKHKHGTISLRVNSQTMLRDLAKLGVIRRKTYNMHVPDLGESLIRHLLRGIFDADGCIYVRKSNRQPVVTIVGHRDTCGWVQSLLSTSVGRSGNVYFRKANTYSWEMGGRKQVKLFADFIYDNGGFKLNRKYEKFQEEGLACQYQ